MMEDIAIIGLFVVVVVAAVFAYAWFNETK
jgi:hypothetical protein